MATAATGDTDPGCGAAASEPDDGFVASVFARECTSRAAMHDVASKWGILALLALREEAHRFNALRRRMEGVGDRMLSQTLQTLERDGMVNRDVQATIPPHVEYSLTPLGTQVADRVRGLADLLEASAGAIGEARERYDAR